MSKDCSYYREQIPKAMLDDLAVEDRQTLDLHLLNCPACRLEKELYAGTFQQLDSLEDVPVPRHFFVYPEERAANPWRLFRLMHPAWQGAVAVTIVAMGMLTAFAASRLQVRSENGAWTLAFGKLPPLPAAPAPAIDIGALEARIVQIVEEKDRKERLEWVRTLRSEIAGSRRSLSQYQQVALDTALANSEARMDRRIEQTALSIQDQNNRSLSNLYQTVSQQREGDMATIDGRLTRLAVSGQIKSTQTDAILETLLQVAELRMK